MWWWSGQRAAFFFFFFLRPSAPCLSQQERGLFLTSSPIKHKPGHPDYLSAHKARSRNGGSPPRASSHLETIEEGDDRPGRLPPGPARPARQGQRHGQPVTRRGRDQGAAQDEGRAGAGARVRVGRGGQRVGDVADAVPFAVVASVAIADAAAAPAALARPRPRRPEVEREAAVRTRRRADALLAIENWPAAGAEREKKKLWERGERGPILSTCSHSPFPRSARALTRPSSKPSSSPLHPRRTRQLNPSRPAPPPRTRQGGLALREERPTHNHPPPLFQRPTEKRGKEKNPGDRA